jgi:hypothetical protein
VRKSNRLLKAVENAGSAAGTSGIGFHAWRRILRTHPSSEPLHPILVKSMFDAPYPNCEVVSSVWLFTLIAFLLM